MRWKIVTRVTLSSALAAGLVSAALTGSASAFRAEVIPHTTDFDVCHFEPGDVPGVNVDFPAACTIVITSSGHVEIAAHGQLPAGFTLESTIIGQLPCFNFGNGRVVATPSGQVSATCHTTLP
jgi:hypothetical protein